MSLIFKGCNARCRWSLLTISVFVIGNVFSQKNLDTPNLSFESGNLQYWEQYVGGIYLDNTDSLYKYEPWVQTTNTPQIQIMNGFATSQDPVISCWDFPTNPDGLTTVRIGSTAKAENDRLGNSAMAEKLVYKFTVTENTTLFSYRFAAVLHCPELVTHSVSDHVGEQLPTFNLSIDMYDPSTGLNSKLPCGEFSVNADANNSLSLELVSEQPNTTCRGSIATNQITEFAFRRWTSGGFDLSKHIGKEVTITVITHDCLRLANGEIGPGSHRAYGYFWAETSKLKLSVKNCGLEDAEIMAPPGFTSYEWSRSDGYAVQTDPADPSKAIIPVEMINAGVTYSCKLQNDYSSCAPVVLTTQLDEIGVDIDFDIENDCAGLVRFTNKTIMEGDKIIGYSWDFGDGSVSSLENPEHQYAVSNDYDVTLTVFTELGCSKSFKKKIGVRYFPNLKISAADSVCIGEEVEITALEASVGSKFKWDTGDTTQTIKYKMTASKEFNVEVEDENFCSYTTSYWIIVKPNAEFLIQGDKEVCLNDTVRLTARAYTANDNLIYSWNTGHRTDTMSARPLKDGTVYTVTGTYKNGCSTTKDVEIKVNPLPVISLDGNTVICKGETTTLTADVVSSIGNVTYIWSDLYEGKTRDVMPETTTSYQVYGVDEKKCQSLPQDITVKVKPLPELTILGNTTVCEGKSVQLTVSGAGSNVKWYDGTEGITTITRTPKQDTTYWVEGLSNGCSGKAEVTVKLLDVPYVWIDASSQSICKGDTVVLYAKGADSYVWSGGEVTDSISEIPITTSEYSVVGTTTNGGCVGTGSIVITVNQSPMISVSGDNSVCDGEVAKIQASGAEEYFWSNNGYGANLSLPITENLDLTVRGVDANQCEGTATWTIKKKDLPTLSYSGDTAVCRGNLLNITVSGANSYVWHDGTQSSVYSSLLEADRELKVKGTIDGCSSSLLIPVRILSVPSLWASGSGITGVCPDSTAMLIAHGAKRYQWGNGETTDTIRFVPSISTNYMLYGYSEDECEAMISVPVKVNPRPLVYVKGDNQACKESTVRIEAYDANEGTNNFMWDNGSVGPVITPKILDNTTFKVLAQNQFGCMNTATFDVSLISPPVLSFDGRTSLCLGESTTIIGRGALMYSWDDGSTLSTGGSINITPQTNTVVRMTGSDVGNCPATIDIQIMVMTPPSIHITGETEACMGDSISIYASGAESYKWNTGDTTSAISFRVGSSAEYTVSGKNEFGCSASKSQIVKVRPAPHIEIEKGLQTGCQNLPDTIRLKATGAQTYKWTSEPYNVSVAENGYTADLLAIFEEPTTLFVEGRDVFGCVGTAQKQLDMLPRQMIDFAVGPSFIEEGSSNVRFTGISPKESIWFWEPGDGSKEISGVNTSHYFNPTMADSFVVKVRAIDKYGCEYTGRSSVYTWLDFWGPEAFTPNEDELNDTFKFRGGEYMDYFHFIIYNRLGEIVFTGNSINDEWDGTLNGEPCPWGVYGWYVDYKSNFMGANKEGERRGFVSIIR